VLTHETDELLDAFRRDTGRRRRGVVSAVGEGPVHEDLTT
jgi:hypothetical protein